MCEPETRGCCHHSLTIGQLLDVGHNGLSEPIEKTRKRFAVRRDRSNQQFLDTQRSVSVKVFEYLLRGCELALDVSAGLGPSISETDVGAMTQRKVRE